MCNPLVGEDGATYVYGKQKGADDASLAHMEKGMCHYATLLRSLCGREVASVPGCGAGGLASPLIALCRVEITSGIRAVLETVELEEHLQEADLAPDAAYSMAHAGELLSELARGYFKEFLDRKLAERH